MDQTLKEWQTRLGLGDWTIKLTANARRLPDDSCCGYSDWSETGKCAHIYLLHPDEYGDRIVPYDEEKTLVHELLHLKFSLLDNQKDDLQNRVLHQLIDDISKALVEAKREQPVAGKLDE